MTGQDAAPTQAEVLAWVERVATYFARHNGLPPISGRVLGWLMVCDPPEQSAAELAQAVGASRASLTTTLRVLTASGFVESQTRPGERTGYYRIADEAWADVTRRRMASLASFLDVTEQGLALFGAEAARSSRIRAAHELFGWLDAEVGPLWRRWDARKHADQVAPANQPGAPVPVNPTARSSDGREPVVDPA
jgi:DNA-binding transcriptional ArsR family regulator